MHTPGFIESLGRSLSGPGLFGGSFQFRLIVQPLAAIALGARIGIKDAKQRNAPIFLALLRGDEGRGRLFTRAVRVAAVPLLIALVVDSILQRMINGRIRPLAALLVSTLLVFSPFMIARAAANRIWSRTHPGPRNRPEGPR